MPLPPSWQVRRGLPPKVAAQLRAARIARGQTQREVAEAATVHRPFIAALEAGVRRPSTDVAERLVAALELDDLTALQLREAAS